MELLNGTSNKMLVVVVMQSITVTLLGALAIAEGYYSLFFILKAAAALGFLGCLVTALILLGNTEEFSEKWFKRSAVLLVMSGLLALVGSYLK